MSSTPKDIRLNSTLYLIEKNLNKRELQQIAFNHSLDIGYEDFMNLCKKFSAKPYLLVIDTTLVSDNPLRLKFFLKKKEQKKLAMTTEHRMRDEKL